MPCFERAGATFNYLDVGAGVPFVFQHGIGGDVSQPARVFSPPLGVRLLSFDCRAHGATVSAGKPADLTFLKFGDDLVAFLDHLGIDRAVVGGISMGAGVALNVAVRYPERLTGLVLARPAWLDGPMPDPNIAVYDLLAGLLRTADGEIGWALERLEVDPRFAAIAACYPDPANSLRGQLTSPHAVERVARLERLPRDRPIMGLRDTFAIKGFGNDSCILGPFVTGAI
jgi:pimeloyl-ACP methyl ester carboxylesterase